MYHNQLFSQSQCPVVYLRRVQGESLRFRYPRGTYAATPNQGSPAIAEGVHQAAQHFSVGRRTILPPVVTLDGPSR